MKLATNTVEKTGNLVFEEEEAMDFDPAARGILLNNFIQQYTEPYSAALREYTSNALDEHILTGNPRPIEVTLPSPLSPNLVIRDWGRGMNRDDLKAYARFGFSSKRDSDLQRGGFGLGSKSGLAIASQFTVSSIKDGMRNMVVIGRDEHGSPQSGFLPATPSDLPNGTTITIPTSEVRRFRTAIEEGMFIGWKPGTILINGEAPKRSLHDEKYFRKLEDFGWQAIGQHSPMGDYYKGTVDLAGVRMSVDWARAGVEDTNLRRGYLSSIVLKLDNSTVELLRSREGFIYDARTRKAIQDRVNDVAGIARAEYQKEIEDAPSFRDALKIRLTAESYGFAGKYTYKGESLIFDAYTGDKRLLTTVTASYDDKAQRNTTYVDYAMGSSLAQTLAKADTILVYGAGAPARKTVHSQELHPESHMAHWYLRYVSERDSKSMRDTVLYYTHMTLAEVKAARLDRLFPTVLDVSDVQDKIVEHRKAVMAATRKANKAAKVTPTVTKVDLVRFNAWGGQYSESVELGQLDTTKTYVLLQTDASTFGNTVKRALTTQIGASEHPQLVKFLQGMIKDDKFTVIVANKSVDTSGYGKVITLEPIEKIVQDEIDSLQAGFTETQLIALRDLRGSGAAWARNLKPSSVAQLSHDETREWAQALRDSKMQERFAAANTAAKLAEQYPSTLKAPKNVAAVSTKPSPSERYPLLAHTGYYSTPDSVALHYIKLVDDSLAAKP